MGSGQALESRLHDKVKFSTDPGVGGRIIDLRGAQGALLPVGKLGGLRKPLLEEDRGKISKAGLLDFQ